MTIVVKIPETHLFSCSLYMEPDIWKMKAVSATMETLLLVLDNSPHSKHLISLVLRSWSRFLL